MPFGLFILRPFLRATLPDAKSNLQKFFHLKSAVSINILKIAGTAIAKHIDRTHTHAHTHTGAGRQEAIAAPGRFLCCCCQFAWLAALSSCSVWFMNACADICHVSAWSRASTPSPSHLPSLANACFGCIVSAENYATIFLLCLGNFVHCWLIHSHSKQKANVLAMAHTHTHTHSYSLSLALLVISAGKSKHFKLSILRITCGISSQLSSSWVQQTELARGNPITLPLSASDLTLEMLFVRKMIKFGYNINPIASFVFDKYKNSSYSAIWDFQHLLWYIKNLQGCVSVCECARGEFEDPTTSVQAFEILDQLLTNICTIIKGSRQQKKQIK